MSPDKITFINTLFKRTGQAREAFQFLERNFCVSNDYTQRFFQEHHAQQAAIFINKLVELEKEGKLQLVHYEWHILPNEKMLLQLVANSEMINIQVGE